MIEHKFNRRSSKTEHPGELTLTITIVGAHDIYRFAHHMLLGQVEFADRARRILRAVRRRMGDGRWGYLDRSMGGWKMRGEREPVETSAGLQTGGDRA